MIGSSIKVCITGATGQIAYSFLPLLLSGQVFGKSKIQLTLLGTQKSKNNLKGLVMELNDGLFSLLQSVKSGWQPKQMFKERDVIVFLGGFPKKEGMKRSDLLQSNKSIFKEQGQALSVASPNVKCLVVSNPCNTNAAVLNYYSGGKIKPQNITCLTRLDHNRAVSQISEKTGKEYDKIHNVVIFGNHSDTMCPSIQIPSINHKSLISIVGQDWLENVYVQSVANRGAQIIQARNNTATLSSAIAIRDHLHDWYHGTDGQIVSMGVRSEGDYGIPKGVWTSLPVECSNFEYKIIKQFQLSQSTKRRIKISTEQLLQELKEAGIPH